MTIRLGLFLCLISACDSGVNNMFGTDDANFNHGDGFVLPGQGDLATADGPTLSGLDLAGSAEGPDITITAPAQTMPLTEVPYDTLTVQATIVGKNGASIDATTVQVLIPANNQNGFISAPLSLTSAANVYKGSIDIGSIRSGDSEFTVVATDVHGKQGAAKGSYTHDHGPVITFIQPSRPTATGSMYVEVLIDDALHPLKDASTVKATIHNGDTITLTPIAGASPLRVQGTVKFSDYSPPLDGDQLLTVTATNDHGTVGTGVKQFTVDNLGPSITFVNPLAGAFVGGVLQIKATITDLSDVNDSTVVAVFGGDLSKSVQLTRILPNMPDFEGLFDVRQLGTNYVLPALSIRADDQLGNHSEKAEEIVVDNVPPFMSLDPPKLRGFLLKPGNFTECSELFDPLGDETANDGEKVQQVFSLRARVEDKGNDAPGLRAVRVSLVDHTSVKLIGIPAANGPLAVDTDGDGVCDDVNPELVPTTDVTASNQAVALSLTTITPGGQLDFTPSPSPFPPGCSTVGDAAATLPLPLCLNAGTQLTYAMSYTVGTEPSIWTIPPVTTASDSCVGFDFDSLNRMPEGPACFVVVAKDNAGNHSVSAPLRVCIDRGGTACNSWNPINLPSCLGTYDKAMMKTNSTACTLPSTFQPGELHQIN